MRKTLARLAATLASKNSQIEKRVKEREQEGKPVTVEFREGTVWAGWSK